MRINWLKKHAVLPFYKEKMPKRVKRKGKREEVQKDLGERVHARIQVPVLPVVASDTPKEKPLTVCDYGANPSQKAYDCMRYEQCDDCFMVDHFKICAGCKHYEHS